jgi:phosphoglycerate kinase
MTPALRTLDDVHVEGRRVLLRADLNVPLVQAAPGMAARVVDDTRIRAALPTIRELRRHGAAFHGCRCGRSRIGWRS